MKLFHASASPFVRRVMVMLHETDQIDEVEIASVAITPLAGDDGLNAANPLGKIPALERPDGPTLYDSRVICRYLDARRGNKMYPASRVWETLTLEATADGIMEAAVLMVYEKRVRPEDKQYDVWVEAQWTKASRALATINARWMSHLSGPLDAAHIGVGCALGYLDFRHEDRDWRKSNDALAAWYDTFQQRASMQATLPG